MQTFKYKWDWNIFKSSHIENAGQLHHNFHQHYLSHSSTLKTKEQRLLSKCYIQHQSCCKREFQIRLSYSAINNKIIKLSEMLSLDCRRSQEIFGSEPFKSLNRAQESLRRHLAFYKYIKCLFTQCWTIHTLLLIKKIIEHMLTTSFPYTFFTWRKQH